METDFLVIGGGVAGVTVGAELTALGRVTLWEAEAQCGSHASGRSAALFDESYGLPPVVALNRASRAAHAGNGDLSPRGLMLIGLSGQENTFDADLGRMFLDEMPVDEARGHVPILSDAVTRTAYDPHAHDIDTD